MTNLQRILVGVDGSEDGQHALEWCVEFALRSNVEVIVCHVVSNFGEWMLSAGQIDFQKIEQEHQWLLNGPWTEPLRGGTVRYEVVQVSGDPVKELLARAGRRCRALVGRMGFLGHAAIRNSPPAEPRGVRVQVPLRHALRHTGRRGFHGHDPLGRLVGEPDAEARVDLARERSRPV
jgi:Universal stress protein family